MKTTKKTHDFKALELKVQANSVSPHLIYVFVPALELKVQADSVSPHLIYFKEHSVREHTIEKPSGRTLFIINVPPYADEKGLTNAFSEAGKVTTVIFSSKPNSQETKPDTIWSAPLTPTFQVCYLVFKKVADLDKALKLTQLHPMNSDGHEIQVGMAKWVEQYNNTIQQHKSLKMNIESFMKEHDKKATLKQKEEKQLEQEDSEGWVTVTKGGKVQSFARTEKVESKIMDKEERNKKRKELKNFYTFQIRESKMKHIVALRQKFEEDKKKIAQIKQSRRFKPF